MEEICVIKGEQCLVKRSYFKDSSRYDIMLLKILCDGHKSLISNKISHNKGTLRGNKHMENMLENNCMTSTAQLVEHFSAN